MSGGTRGSLGSHRAAMRCEICPPCPQGRGADREAERLREALERVAGLAMAEHAHTAWKVARAALDGSDNASSSDGAA